MSIKRDITDQDIERAQLLTFEKGTHRSEPVWVSSLKDYDIKILYEAGAQLLYKGCRCSFDEHITDMYLKPARGWHRINHTDAHRLREILEGTDKYLALKVVEPRLQIIRNKITVILIKYLKNGNSIKFRS